MKTEFLRQKECVEFEVQLEGQYNWKTENKQKVKLRWQTFGKGQTEVIQTLWAALSQWILPNSVIVPNADLDRN